MESFAYILILTLAIATLFFAIAFRDPPNRQVSSVIENPASAGFFVAGTGRGSSHSDLVISPF